MKYIKKISWKELWLNWKKDELNIWNHLIKDWGFSSWDTWRDSYVQPLHLDKKTWELFEISPEEILDFECGNFEKWNEISEIVKSRKFKDICQAEVFKNFEKIQSLKKNLPKNIQLIGIKNGETIAIFEGHHRCTAIAQLLQQNIKPTTRITISITEL